MKENSIEKSQNAEKHKMFYLPKINRYMITATKHICTSDNLGYMYSGKPKLCVTSFTAVFAFDGSGLQLYP